MYQELPSVAAIIMTRIHSGSMIIPFPITPSGLTSVKKRSTSFWSFLNNFFNNNRKNVSVEVSFTSWLKYSSSVKKKKKQTSLIKSTTLQLKYNQLHFYQGRKCKYKYKRQDKNPFFTVRTVQALVVKTYRKIPKISRSMYKPLQI